MSKGAGPRTCYRRARRELYPDPCTRTQGLCVRQYLCTARVSDTCGRRRGKSRTPYTTVDGRTEPRTVPSRLKLEALRVTVTVYGHPVAVLAPYTRLYGCTPYTVRRSALAPPAPAPARTQITQRSCSTYTIGLCHKSRYDIQC